MPNESIPAQPWHYRKSPMGYAICDAQDTWLFDVQTEPIAKLVCAALDVEKCLLSSGWVRSANGEEWVPPVNQHAAVAWQFRLALESIAACVVLNTGDMQAAGIARAALARHPIDDKDKRKDNELKYVLWRVLQYHDCLPAKIVDEIWKALGV